MIYTQHPNKIFRNKQRERQDLYLEKNFKM